MHIFDSTMHTLENSLDYAVQKNQIISNNIANVDTPNYKAKNLSFKHFLDQEVHLSGKRSHPEHLSFTSSKPSFTTSRQNTAFNHNGNNVDMEKEMSDLAENQIYYQSLVDRLNGKFGLLQSVIRGGK